MIQKRSRREERFFCFVALCIVIFFNQITFCHCKFKRLGDSCHQHLECDTGVCHPLRKICECYELLNYNEGKKLDQLYEYGNCFSRLYQMCTLQGTQLDDLTPFTCVNGAYCTFAPNGRSSRKLFGYCVCKLGYVPFDSNRRCMLKSKLPKADENTPIQSNQQSFSKNSYSAAIRFKIDLAVCYTLFLILLI